LGSENIKKGERGGGDWNEKDCDGGKEREGETDRLHFISARRGKNSLGGGGGGGLSMVLGTEETIGEIKR